MSTKRYERSKSVMLPFMVAEKTKYIAQDANGYWRYYSKKPRRGEFHWIPAKSDIFFKENEYTIMASGKVNPDWGTSLIKL